MFYVGGKSFSCDVGVGSSGHSGIAVLQFLAAGLSKESRHNCHLGQRLGSAGRGSAIQHAPQSQEVKVQDAEQKRE